MEASSAGEVPEQPAASSSSSARLSLLNLPAESLSNIVSYIPRKSLFPLLIVSKQFHQLASAALYRQLSFNLAQSDIAASHRDPAYRLPEALHTFLTSSYDYSQHVKSFSLRMVDTDLEHVQKRIAAKFLAREEAGMLLNTALLVMVKRAKALETFNWQVPIECNNLVYQALAGNPSLQTLHIHLDVQSVTKHHYNLPPPPPPPGAGFGGQTSVWWDPVNGSSVPSTINSTAGSSKSSRSATPSRTQKRKLGAIKGLQSLTVTAIDDLGTLDEIASCLQGSSKSLRALTLSFAETLVSKSQRPSANNPHNLIPVQDDDATTEPNSPDLNATGSAPTDLDLKREKQAQEQALSRIFGLEKPSATTEKQDKKVEKSLKRTSKSVRPDKNKSVNKLANQLLGATMKDLSIDSKTKKKLQHLLTSLSHTHPGNMSSHNHNGGGYLVTSSKKTKDKFPSNDHYVGDWEYKPPKPAEYDYNPPSSSNMPPIPSWNSNTMPLPIDPPKTSVSLFPESSSNHFTVSAPGLSMPSGYPLSSPSSYSYSHNPKSSSQALLPVSSLQVIKALATPHEMQKFVTTWGSAIASWNPAASTKIFVEYEKLLSTLPPELSIKLDQAILIEADMLSQDPSSYNSSSSKKKKPIPVPMTPSDSSSESSSSSESGSESESSTVQPSLQPVVVLDLLPADEQESDFDMDHPDVLETEEDGDANDEEDDSNDATTTELDQIDDEIVADSKDKGKAKAQSESTDRAETLTDLPNGVSHLDLTEQATDEKAAEKPAKILTVEETIQEYVRMTHGLSIQDLTLSFIPIKSSVLAKALDLTTLRRLILHNVGAQGAFWTMIEKLIDQGVVFSFQTLHTDDVSPSFISCLGKLPGLKALHLLRRSSKEFSCTSNKPAPTLSDIYRIGLKRHFETLQSLSITNLEDDSWDLDDRVIRALSNKARRLKELAFAVDSNSFHTFLRCLPGLRSLVALHFINIKVSGAPSLMPHNEWKRLILDVLCYCPSLRLKYVGIALVTTGRVSQIGNKPDVSLNEWYRNRDKSANRSSKDKGKGKALSPPPATDPAKPANDFSDIEDERPNAIYAKTYRTGALADSYSIFGSLVLKGRL